jgi:hypothetical protein
MYDLNPRLGLGLVVSLKKKKGIKLMESWVRVGEYSGGGWVLGLG